MKKNEYGFSAHLILVLVLITAITGIAGYIVWSKSNRNTSKTSVNQTTNTQQIQDTIPDQAEDLPLTQPVTEPNPVPPPNPPPATPQPATSKPATKSESVNVYYRVLGDNDALVSPVSTILADTTKVTLTLELQCPGSCQFKLKSDSVNLENDTTYTSNQSISYQIDSPGEHIFYNQYTPNVKFKIKF